MLWVAVAKQGERPTARPNLCCRIHTAAIIACSVRGSANADTDGSWHATGTGKPPNWAAPAGPRSVELGAARGLAVGGLRELLDYGTQQQPHPLGVTDAVLSLSRPLPDVHRQCSVGQRSEEVLICPVVAHR